jgi:hypothetical protein
MPPVCPLEIPSLLLLRSSESRPLAVGPDDYDVIGKNGEVVGRIIKTGTGRAGMSFMWSLATRRRDDEVPVLVTKQPAKPRWRRLLGAGIQNDRGVSPEVRPAPR